MRVAAFICEALGEQEPVDYHQCSMRYNSYWNPKRAEFKGKDVPWIQEEVG